MTAGIRVRGDARLAATLTAAGRDVAELDDAAAAAGRLVTAAAKRRTPRRSGRLAGSIRSTPAGGSVSIWSPVVYAGVIEYGWPRRTIAAAAMIRGAVDASRPRVVELYRKDAQRVCDTVKGA